MASPVAIGVDIVDVAKFKAIYIDLDSAALERVFTATELADVGAECDRVRRLAARFAAKEAAFKALGGIQDGMAWTDVVVGRLDNGAPVLTILGSAAARAEELGITAWLISLAHLESFAVASVVAVGGPR